MPHQTFVLVAEAALIVLESHARRIHVLFTDIQMPGTMDGLALAHHTSKHWPWIGLLVTSARPQPGSRRISRGKPIFGEAIPAPPCHSSYSRASGGGIMRALRARGMDGSWSVCARMLAPCQGRRLFASSISSDASASPFCAASKGCRMASMGAVAAKLSFRCLI